MPSTVAKTLSRSAGSVDTVRTPWALSQATTNSFTNASLPRLGEDVHVDAAPRESVKVEPGESALERPDHELLRDAGGLRGEEPARHRAAAEEHAQDGGSVDRESGPYRHGVGARLGISNARANGADVGVPMNDTEGRFARGSRGGRAGVRANFLRERGNSYTGPAGRERRAAARRSPSWPAGSATRKRARP